MFVFGRVRPPRAVSWFGKRTLVAIRYGRRTGYLLVALHTACLLLGVHFFLQGRLTDALYDRLVTSVVDPSMSDEDRVLRLMDTTSRVQWATKQLVAPRDPKVPELARSLVVPGTSYMLDSRSSWVHPSAPAAASRKLWPRH